MDDKANGHVEDVLQRAMSRISSGSQPGAAMAIQRKRPFGVSVIWSMHCAEQERGRIPSAEPKHRLYGETTPDLEVGALLRTGPGDSFRPSALVGGPGLDLL